MKLRKKEKTPPSPSQPTGLYEVAPHEIPAIRIATAIGNKSDKELCFVVGGGLGDRVCAEPTLRYAIENFQGVNISLICDTPQLFDHLEFKEVFNFKDKHPIIGRHLYLHTYPTTPLFNQFVNPNLFHCVDYPSLAALRMQLPMSYKTVDICPQFPDRSRKGNLNYAVTQDEKYVILHLGKSWPSRTFPTWWWENIISSLIASGKKPVLIGNNCVEISDFWKSVCVDLTDSLNLDQYLFICFHCNYMITNDSSPLHIAAAGEKAKIAFVSTCRRGDLITHYRPEYGAGMKDFAHGWMWSEYNLIPNNLDVLTMQDVPFGKIDDWLPPTEEVVDWIVEEEEDEEEYYD